MVIRLFTAAALVLSVGTASASQLTFENGFLADGTPITGDKTAITGTEFQTDFGVRFSSNQNLNIVQVGGATDGFVPNDTPAPADRFGSYFLTSDFGTTTSLFIDYDVGVSAASFDVADIDGSGDNLEKFTFLAKSASGGLLASQIVTGATPGAGDASVVRIGFSGLSDLIQRIEISGTTEGGTRKIGIAFDNFNTKVDTTTPIPLPAGLPLALAALGALGLVRSRRKG